jgi:hypothetical protein
VERCLWVQGGGAWRHLGGTCSKLAVPARPVVRAALCVHVVALSNPQSVVEALGWPVIDRTGITQPLLSDFFMERGWSLSNVWVRRTGWTCAVRGQHTNTSTNTNTNTNTYSCRPRSCAVCVGTAS